MTAAPLTLVLALTLVGTAAMFLVIARQLRGRGWVATFACGLALFGLVFAAPVDLEARTALPVALAVDAAAVAAILVLRRGLQLFLRRRATSWRSIAAVVLLFAAATFLAQQLLGLAARSAGLDLALALAFGWLALPAARESRGDNPLLRVPLVLLAAVLVLLGVLSLGQALHTISNWPSAASPGSAQVFDVLVMSGALLLGPMLLWMHTAQLAHQLDELAMRDPLTRLLNENGLDELLRRHFGRRQHEPVTLMMIDVDGFRRVNELHGEAAGDDVLRMIGLALESGLRVDDLVARVGGEEFLVCCMGGDVGAAVKLAERLRNAVAAIQTGLADGPGGHLRCAVSIGVAGPIADHDGYKLVWSQAESALQSAKDAGGNCVVSLP